MELFKMNVLLSFVILGSANAFCVVGIGDTPDSDYVKAAKPHQAVCEVFIRYDREGETVLGQRFTGSLIEHKGLKAILTTASAFEKESDVERVTVFDGTSYKILSHEVYPQYVKTQKMADKDAARTASISCDFALGFLEKDLEHIMPLSLGEQDFGSFTTPCEVTIVGFGKGGRFNQEALGRYTTESGTKRLCQMRIQQQTYNGLSRAKYPFLESAPIPKDVPHRYGAVAKGDSGAPVFDEKGAVMAVAVAVDDTTLGHMETETCYKDAPWPVKSVLLGVDRWLASDAPGSHPLKQSFFRFAASHVVTMPQIQLNKQVFAPITPAVKTWMDATFSSEVD